MIISPDILFFIFGWPDFFLCHITIMVCSFWGVCFEIANFFIMDCAEGFMQRYFVLLLLIMFVLPTNVHGQSQEVWSAPATEKIFQDRSGNLSTIPRTDNEVSLVSARGGRGFFQVVLSPSTSVTGVTVSVTDLVGSSMSISSSNIEVYLEYYVHVRDTTFYESVLSYELGYYPDALIPLSSSFQIDGNKNQPLWIEVYVPENTVAGSYTGSIKIEGGLSGEVVINLEVLDFTLPSKTQLYNNAAGDYWELSAFTSSQEEYRDLVLRYSKFFAERDITDGNTFDAMGVVPEKDGSKWDMASWFEAMSPLLEQYRQYFDVPVVNVPIDFEVLGFDLSSASSEDSQAEYMDFLTQFRDYVLSDGSYSDFEWVVWITDLDEPNTADMAWLIAQYALLTMQVNTDSFKFHYRVDGTIDWSSPMVQLDLEADTSGWEPLDDKFTVWTAPQEDIEWDKSFVDSALARGAIVTIYQQAWTALPAGDEDIPPNVEDKNYEFPSVAGIVNPAIFSRVLPWVVYRYGLSGINFWAIMAWYNAEKDTQLDMFEASPALTIRDGLTAQNGDGFLVYPGQYISKHTSQADVNGPIPSLRLELLRMGLEDYKYIKLLADGDFGDSQMEASTLLSQVSDLVKSVTDFDRDPKNYDELMRKIKTFLGEHGIPSLTPLDWSIEWSPSPLSNKTPEDNSPIPWLGMLVAFPILEKIKNKRKFHS